MDLTIKAKLIIFIVIIVFLFLFWLLSIHMRKKQGATFSLLQKPSYTLKSYDAQLAAAQAKREAQRSKQLAANRGQGKIAHI